MLCLHSINLNTACVLLLIPLLCLVSGCLRIDATSVPIYDTSEVPVDLRDEVEQVFGQLHEDAKIYWFGTALTKEPSQRVFRPSVNIAGNGQIMTSEGWQDLRSRQ